MSVCQGRVNMWTRVSRTSKDIAFDLCHPLHGRPLWMRMELVYFQTPSVAPLSMGRLKEKYFLHQQLSAPRVTILLVTSRVDLFFRGTCHVSLLNWLRCFKYLDLRPINSGIPPLPFIFLKFPSLSFLVLAPHLEVSSRPYFPSV